VLESLRAWRAGRTVLIVAHRLSTVVDADIICVVQEGAVAERGSHGALLAAGGLYAELWNRQATSGSVAEGLSDAGAGPAAAAGAPNGDGAAPPPPAMVATPFAAPAASGGGGEPGPPATKPQRPPGG